MTARYVCLDCLYETSQWVHAESHEMTQDHYLVNEEDDEW